MWNLEKNYPSFSWSFQNIFYPTQSKNIVAKEYFDAGDKKTANDIQEMMMLHMGGYFVTPPHTEKTDEEVLETMKKQLELILANPDLKKTVLKNLRETQENWIKFRNQKI